jgi:hypothetical protein
VIPQLSLRRSYMSHQLIWYASLAVSTKPFRTSLRKRGETTIFIEPSPMTWWCIQDASPRRPQRGAWSPRSRQMDYYPLIEVMTWCCIQRNSK